MAKTVVITDDLDGSADAETVEFSLAGTSYTIDLGRKNRAALEKALKPYIAAAAKAGRSARPAASSGRAAKAARKTTGARRSRRTGPDLALVRAWAGEQGIEVAARGRVSQDIIDAYTAAH